MQSGFCQTGPSIFPEPVQISAIPESEPLEIDMGVMSPNQQCESTEGVL